MVSRGGGRGSDRGEGVGRSVGSMVVRRDLSRDGVREEGGCGNSASGGGDLEREEE